MLPKNSGVSKLYFQINYPTNNLDFEINQTKGTVRAGPDTGMVDPVIDSVLDLYRFGNKTGICYNILVRNLELMRNISYVTYAS